MTSTDGLPEDDRIAADQAQEIDPAAEPPKEPETAFDSDQAQEIGDQLT